jgi:hypothetical protein
MVSFFSGVRFLLCFEKGCDLNCYRNSNNVCKQDCTNLQMIRVFLWLFVHLEEWSILLITCRWCMFSGHAKLSMNLHLTRCGNWRTFMVACMVCFPTNMGFKASVHVGIHFGWWNLSLKAVLVSRVPIGFFGSFVLLFIMVLKAWFVFFQKHMDSVIN